MYIYIYIYIYILECSCRLQRQCMYSSPSVDGCNADGQVVLSRAVLRAKQQVGRGVSKGVGQ
jgi:hypothetical protein